MLGGYLGAPYLGPPFFGTGTAIPTPTSTFTPLVTVAEVESAQPTFASVDADEQERLINGATAAINRVCDRVLGSASYTERHTPGRSRLLRCRQWPVTAIARIGADLTPIVTLQYTGTSPRASARYSTTGAPGFETYTGLDLVPGGTVASSLLFSTYTTAATLTAAINLVTGWTATAATGYDSWLTADLVAGIGAKGAIATQLNLAAMTRDLDYDLTDDRRTITLLEGFVDDYRYPDRMYGSFLGWSVGPRESRSSVVGLYTAGYETEDVPGDLKEACIQTIKYFQDRRAASGVYKSKSVGDESYAFQDNAGTMSVPSNVVGMLRPWRRCDVA